MHYAGIDAHKNYLTIAIVDNQGELVSEEKRVPIGDGEPLVAALEGPRPMEAVVETCPFWPWIHDVIGEATEVGSHLAHASRLEAIAKAETKTDSVDARLLARMLGAGRKPSRLHQQPLTVFVEQSTASAASQCVCPAAIRARISDRSRRLSLLP